LIEVERSIAFASIPNSQAIVDKFKNYKTTSLVPSDFGRDGNFSEHNGCREHKVFHLHLKTEAAIKDRKWYSSNPYYRTSNTHLIYCQGSVYLNRYLLIAILSPNAHELARKNDIMGRIADTAWKFRSAN